MQRREKMRCSEIMDILEIMRLSEMGLTQRQIAESVNCGKTTVGGVQKRCREAGLAYSDAEGMTAAEIMARLYPREKAAPGRPQPDWEAIHNWLKAGKRRNLQYAWEEFRGDGADGLGYSQFCRLYRAWKDSTGKTASMVQDHAPGDKMFIDWVGDTLDCVVDAETGEVQTAHFFVAVLGYSCYPYVEAFPNEQMESWLAANINALEHFGGVPRIGVPDNTTTAVTKPHYFDPALNRTYLEFAQHYGMAIMPARPYKPKDKSLAEGSVGWLETWLLEWLRGQRFFGFGEMNRAIRARVAELAARPFQKRAGSRASEYEEHDKPALRPLPQRRYEYAQFLTRRVPDSYHVEFDGHYYSVPHSLFRQVVTVRATLTMVEVVSGNRERVALHQRSHGGSRYVTDPSHMTEGHRRQREANRRTGADYIAWAVTIGENTREVVEKMLGAQAFEETAYRSCMGVLQFAAKYSPGELEAACGRAVDAGSPCYTTVRKFIQNPPIRKPPQPLPEHENLRDPVEFS